METIHEKYMQRCIELARMGEGSVAPNPMVGSVLVYEDRILGEGYHQRYGEGHAEVNCLASVPTENQHLVERSTLYVSLEPCAHFGKTPPCADLIIRQRIPKVVIGCRDPFTEVNGKGIEKLQAAGIEVVVGIRERECLELNKRFFTFHTQHRPYVVLKWAQTLDGKIAAPSGAGETLLASDLKKRLLISNEYSNRLVHHWRSQEMAILVGTRTALLDDPELSTRLWPGSHPIRLVIDAQLELPTSLRLFSGTIPTLIFNLHRHSLPFGRISLTDLREAGVSYYQVTEEVSMVHQVVNALYQLNIQSVLVEGGAYLLQSFIDEGVWDEARVITNEELLIGDGLAAPVLKAQQFSRSQTFASDSIRYFTNRQYLL